MFGILEAAAVPNSGVFKSYEDLITGLNKLMERQGFKIVKTRSHRRKPGGDAPGNEIVRCDLVCDRGGRAYKCLATKHKTKTKKTDCPWKAKAVYRKAAGGWVLTILCNQHNHEAGTPEPLTPAGAAAAGDNAAAQTEKAPPLVPQLDANTSTALQVAGVPNSALRLTGDTFQQFKTDYRKMTHSDRLNALAQLQLRVAAIYAVQNEDMQRQTAQDWRHAEVEANRKALASQNQQPRRQNKSQVGQDQQPKEISSTAVEPRPGPPHHLIASNTTHAPEAFMQERHFQLADPAGGVGSMNMQPFLQLSGASRRTRSDRTNPA